MTSPHNAKIQKLMDIGEGTLKHNRAGKLTQQQRNRAQRTTLVATIVAGMILLLSIALMVWLWLIGDSVVMQGIVTLIFGATAALMAWLLRDQWRAWQLLRTDSPITHTEGVVTEKTIIRGRSPKFTITVEGRQLKTNNRVYDLLREGSRYRVYHLVGRKAKTDKQQPILSIVSIEHLGDDANLHPLRKPRR